MIFLTFIFEYNFLNSRTYLGYFFCNDDVQHTHEECIKILYFCKLVDCLEKITICYYGNLAIFD